MKGTMPIIACDEEHGCDEWTIDWYEAHASNWADLMKGWQYNPHDGRADMFCPEHRTDQGGDTPAPATEPDEHASDTETIDAGKARG